MRNQSQQVPDIARIEELLQDTAALFLEPRTVFDRAIIGITERNSVPVVAYDSDLIIQAMMSEQGMDYEEASEFYEFNTVSAWLGEGTPVYIDRILCDASDTDAADDECATPDPT